MNNVKFLLSEIETLPDFFKKEHLPSLNGFRAVSVLLVIIFHMELSTGYYYKIIFNGSLGVNVFFVISGFLITTLLLKEKIKTGNISLRNFYIRRALRILPAAYLCIITVILLNYFLKLNISPIYICGAFFFLLNFKFLDPYKSTMISHYWSLSVEEQFYFLFPLILKKSLKLFLIFIALIVFVLPVVISVQFLIPAINKGVLFGISHYLIKFQGIAVGCLFSVLCFKNIIKEHHFRRYSIFLKLLLTATIFGLYHTDAVTGFSVYKNLFISILIAWLLILNLYHSNDFYYKFLNLNFISKIGVLSYSIYIWHLIILNHTVMPVFITSFPQNIGFILLAAYISYNFWEKPFLKLKRKFAVVKDRMA